jgi:hypothetical protein
MNGAESMHPLPHTAGTAKKKKSVLIQYNTVLLHYIAPRNTTALCHTA